MYSGISLICDLHGQWKISFEDSNIESKFRKIHENWHTHWQTGTAEPLWRQPQADSADWHSWLPEQRSMQWRLAVNYQFVWGPCNIYEVKMTDNHCVRRLDLTEHYWRRTGAVRWECHEACVHESRHTRYKFLADTVAPDTNVAERHRAFFWLTNEGKHIQKSILRRIMSLRFHCRMFSSCSVAILVCTI